MTQEFYISVTPIWGNDYLVRTERVAPGVPLAEEQVTWAVDDWLTQAGRLMNDPLQGLLRGEGMPAWPHALGQTDEMGQASNLVALGQQLYNALFQGSIRDSWMTAQGIAKHRHEELRLRLGLKDQRLPRLPWEVLHNGDRPLATGTDVVFSRFHSGLTTLIPPALLHPTLEPNQPLKILMVLSAPTDQEVLALKQEAIHLQEELQRTTRTGGRSQPFSEVHLTLLEQPGREELTQSLEHEHYHVFHYAGHSDTGQLGGNLYLVSSKTGLTEILSGDDLAGLLVNNGIRLAVFNSCRGVYTAIDAGSNSNEGNLAEALMKRGVPAVLAMAERIPDDVALTLSRLFYRNLKQGYPIDLSLSRTRQGLVSSYSSHQFYWALPILYLHSAFDGHLMPSTDTSHSPFSTPFSTTPITANPLPHDAPMNPDNLDDMLPDTVLEPYGEALPETMLEPYDDSPNLWQNELEFDPESLELDDMDLQSASPRNDFGSVARLVEQLSRTPSFPLEDDRLLPAPLSENLLPEPELETQPLDYLSLMQHSLYATPTPTLTPVATVPSTGVSITATTQPDSYEIDPETIQTYSALEQLLAETGKLTDTIAACNQAIQLNPNNAEAYDNLGWALQQQGYISEAIAVYTQALRIHPLLASAHHHLGLAFYQKGNIQDAIQSFQRTLQINPNLVEAQHHLGAALQRQAGGLPLPLNAAAQTIYPLTQPSAAAGIGAAYNPISGTYSVQQESTAKTSARTASSWFKTLIILGGIGAIAVTGLWLGTKWMQQRDNSSATPEALPALATSASSTQQTSLRDLQQLSPATLVTLASEQLQQGNGVGSQPAIEALLDRSALTPVKALLTPISEKQPKNAVINFLMGRLIWQSVAQTGDSAYQLADARNYWERAIQEQSNPTYQNAMGFLEYAEGDFKQAEQAWLEALRLAGEPEMGKPSAQPADKSSADALTAYAGLAIAQMKQFPNQPPTRQTELAQAAIQLRNKVLQGDAASFQPNALARNWMWSKSMISDWKAVLALK